MRRALEMTTMRTDIERDRRQTYLPHSSWVGFSSGNLKYGDFFVTNENRLARCHGRVRPNVFSVNKDRSWKILAQVANPSMQWTGEWWIRPEEVIETIPEERMDSSIVEFFDKHCTREE